MWLPFFCLFLGAMLADKLGNWADKIILIALYILLLGMGMNIGGDQKILQAIPVVGIESLLFCIMSSFCSILLVVLWERIFIGKFINSKKNSGQRSFQHELLFILTVAVAFAVGILWGFMTDWGDMQLASYIIELAMAGIYIGIGVSMKFAIQSLIRQKKKALRIIIVPLLVTAGSIIGGLITALVSGYDLVNAAGIGGTMGYYSLGAAMISREAGFTTGLVAFLTGLLREVLTFVIAPLLARFSRLAPIAMGGATTMDVTLPVMKQCLDEEYTLLAFFNGVILSIIVPVFLVILYIIA